MTDPKSIIDLSVSVLWPLLGVSFGLCAVVLFVAMINPHFTLKSLGGWLGVAPLSDSPPLSNAEKVNFRRDLEVGQEVETRCIHCGSYNYIDPDGEPLNKQWLLNRRKHVALCEACQKGYALVSSVTKKSLEQMS